MKKYNLTIMTAGILFVAVCTPPKPAHSDGLLMLITPVLGRSDNDNVNVGVLSAIDSSITEGDSDTKELEFTLTLDNFYGPATVDYTTLDGTATVAVPSRVV
ncbi:MAG: hypothetical protein D3923_16895 [Candidatus Electrothrix sp. AR3]|nr:hypothetical protein [Candidatus Electrothrix sp. AR3]